MIRQFTHNNYKIGGTRGVMVIVVGNGHGFKSWTGLIAFHIALIPFGKRMNPIILPPAMAKIVGQTRFFSLGEATSLGQGKL